jgi:hypothetical protein
MSGSVGIKPLTSLTDDELAMKETGKRANNSTIIIIT